MSAALMCCACSIRQRSSLPFFSGMPLERLLVDVQHLAVAAIADRVDRHLVVVLDRQLRDHPDVVQRVGEHAARRREVGVRLEHPGAARTERAVDGPFGRAHREPLVAVVDDAVFRHVGGELARVLAQHHPDAERQLALVHDPLHHLDGGRRRTGVAHRRQAFRETLAGGELDHLAQIRFHLRGRARGAVARERVADERLRALVEQAARVAVSVLENFSTQGVGRRFRDLSSLHRQRVGEPGVSACVGEPHRIVRRHAAQRVVQRKAFDVGRRDFRPLLLVPAAAEDPLAGPRGLRRFRHHADDVVPVLRGGELQVARRFADAGEVHVRIDEPGRGERALQVDHAGVRADVRLNVLIGTEGDDRVAADRHRLRLRPRIVDGDDRPAAQHEVGRRDGGRRLQRGRRRGARRVNVCIGNGRRTKQQHADSSQSTPTVHECSRAHCKPGSDKVAIRSGASRDQSATVAAAQPDRSLSDWNILSTLTTSAAPSTLTARRSMLRVARPFMNVPFG